jgi:hypothetical protein
MKKLLSLDNALNTGWQNFKKHGGASILIWNAIFFLSLISTLYTLFNPIEDLYISIAYQLVTGIFFFYASIAIYQVYLKAVRAKTFEKTDLIVKPKKLLSIIGMVIIIIIPAIVLILLTIVPFAFLITVPVLIIYSVFISIYFSQATFLILDKSLNPIEALSESFNLINGNGFRYVLFMTCLGTINILGLLCFGIGLLIAGPLTEILKAQLYVNISK